MKFNLLEFNRNFHYYWWLVKRRQRWAERSRRPTWGIVNRWPTRSELWQRTRGTKRRIRSEVDKGWANGMAYVKLIYLKVQKFE
jgi:hypothetical protein